jgi:hypothetical protein
MNETTSVRMNPYHAYSGWMDGWMDKKDRGNKERGEKWDRWEFDT